MQAKAVMERGWETVEVAPPSESEAYLLEDILWGWLTPAEQTAVAHMLPLLAELNQREWELVELLCQSYSGAAVAAHCYLARGTIDNYITNLFRQLGMPDQHGPLNRNLILLKTTQIYRLQQGVGC